jgi:hypothetical protein
MAEDVHAFDDRTECGQEAVAIAIVQEDVLTGVSPGDDVIDAAGDLKAERSSQVCGPG